MAHATHYSPAAQSYAQAILELADERQQPADQVGQELRDLRQLIDANPVFGQFLADPGISREDRTKALDRALSGRVSPLLYNVLGLLNSKGRLGLLPQVAAAFNDLLDEKFGKIEVDVIVAQPLDAGQLEQVRQRVSQALGKDAVVHQYVDESIIGGLVLRVQDQLIDASVRSQLTAIRSRLLAGRSQAVARGGGGGARAF